MFFQPFNSPQGIVAGTCSSSVRNNSLRLCRFRFLSPDRSGLFFASFHLLCRTPPPPQAPPHMPTPPFLNGNCLSVSSPQYYIPTIVTAKSMSSIEGRRPQYVAHIFVKGSFVFGQCALLVTILVVWIYAEILMVVGAYKRHVSAPLSLPSVGAPPRHHLVDIRLGLLGLVAHVYRPTPVYQIL
jgi:hypothetical protein